MAPFETAIDTEVENGAKGYKATESQIVAFKVGQELAEFLNKLPNKSEFIRKAILAQFGMTCPLCTGSGVVPRGLHDHFRPIIAERNSRPCEKCKSAVTAPLSADAARPADRRRFEQFLHGGPSRHATIVASTSRPKRWSITFKRLTYTERDSLGFPFRERISSILYGADDRCVV